MLLATATLFALGLALFFIAAGAEPPLAMLFAIVAAFGAPFYTKFVAGHWYYLVGVAAMPWAFWAALRRTGPWRTALAAGTLSALVSLQPQPWALCEVAIFAFILTRVDLGVRRFWAAPLAVAIGATLSFPQLFGAIGLHSGASLAPQQTMTYWEANNSAQPALAALGLGYFTHYAGNAYAHFGGFYYVLWLVPAAALAGIAYRARKAVVWVIAAIWLLCFCFTAGINGPLGVAIAAAFAHFYWASVFRELYHFALPMWFAGCALAAIGFGYAPRTLRAIGVGALLAAAVVLWWPPAYANQLHSFQSSSAVRAQFAQIRANAGDSRFLMLPSLEPVGPAGLPDAGDDPQASAIGTHPTANKLEPNGMLAAALLLAQRGDARAPDWLRAIGIDRVVERPDLRAKPVQLSSLPMNRLLPALRATDARFDRVPSAERAGGTAPFFAVPTLPIVSDPFRANFPSGFLLAQDVAPQADRSLPQVDRNAFDASRAWSLATYWAWLDPQIAFWEDGAVTWSEAPLPIPPRYRGAWLHAIRYAGTIQAGGRALSLPARIAAWVRLPPAAETLRVKGGMALAIRFARAPQRVQEAAPAHPFDTPLRYSNACTCGEGTVPAGRRWIVLAQRFSPDWVLDGAPVLRHVRYSAYGNAWEIDAAQRSRVTVRYAPSAIWQPMVTYSIVLWCVLAIGAITVRERVA